VAATGLLLVGSMLCSLQTRRDTTVGPAQPMGERGAYVADHVAGSSSDPV
jgi:membrane protein